MSKPTIPCRCAGSRNLSPSATTIPASSAGAQATRSAALSDNPDIEGYLASAFRRIRELDSTRLAVYVTHTAAKQYDEPVLFSDMILFNQYGAHGERADEVHRRYPGKPIFYSEYGTKANSEDPNNTLSDYAAMLSSMRGREHLIGASVWTFNDYRTNYRDSGTAATGNRPWGIVDVYGTPKRGFRELQCQNSPLAEFGLTLTENGAGIALTPRGRLDLPAFRMEGYTVRLSALGADGDTLQRAVRTLPVIQPGDKAFSLQLPLPTAGAARISAELVTPTAMPYTTPCRASPRPPPQSSHGPKADRRSSASGSTADSRPTNGMSVTAPTGSKTEAPRPSTDSSNCRNWNTAKSIRFNWSP